MALFRFNCSMCKANPIAQFGLTAAQALVKAKAVYCPKCGARMVRIVKPPTSQVVERLDDGHMIRAVERPAEAERLYKERAAKDYSKDE